SLVTAVAVTLLSGSALSTWLAIQSNANFQNANNALVKVTEQEKQVGEANAELSKSNAELEAKLARSLLRPLGHNSTLEGAEPEIEALWELVVSSPRVRLLFIEQALHGPVTARQVSNRADLAVHASVGLDPAQRHRVERLLLSRLRNTQSDLRIRSDCILVG